MPLERITQIDQTKPIRNELPIWYLYTTGIAGEKFFREIKDNGRLMGAKCEKCKLIYVPPSLFCERCFSELQEWLEISGQGFVYTFTIVHMDLDGSRLEEPTILAFIKFDGVHGGLIHMLGEVRPEEVKINMPVEVVFKPKEERVGSILDIKYFRPL